MEARDDDRPFLRLALWVAATAPAQWLALFGLFVLRARLALGYWPRPYHPDPKDLGFDLHYLLVFFPLFHPWGHAAFVTSPIAVLAATLAHLLVPRRGERIAAMTCFLSGSAALWLLLGEDPGSFVEWFLD